MHVWSVVGTIGSVKGGLDKKGIRLSRTWSSRCLDASEKWPHLACMQVRKEAKPFDLVGLGRLMFAWEWREGIIINVGKCSIWH
jgi:hypothetical protein